MKDKIIENKVYKTNNYGDIIVIKYFNARDVLIRFIDTSYEKHVPAVDIRRGSIRDPFAKTVEGIGFSGVGEYLQAINGKHLRVNIIWKAILYRCYNKNSLEKNATYKGCTVDEKWHNFQNFAGWYYENYPSDGKVYELDKDLKVIGNKIYSENTCLFIPHNINTFITQRCNALSPNLIGTSYRVNYKKYIARCGNPVTGKRENLGYFNTELEAHLAWRKRKSEIAHELAMQQKNPDVRDALLRWKEALDNNTIHPY